MIKKRGVFHKHEKIFHDNIEVNRSLFFVILIVSVLLIIFAFGRFVSVFHSDAPDNLCGDGSFFSSCSLNRPYFCEAGVLVEKASLCGCARGFINKNDGCTLEMFDNEKITKLNYLFNGGNFSFEFKAYEGANNYFLSLPRAISYEGVKPFRRDFKLAKVNEEKQRELLLPLVVDIQNVASDKDDQARIAISLVQKIEFGKSEKTFEINNKNFNYSRYPYEVIYDQQGICGEKSELLAFLLKELGFGVSIFYYPSENHEAIGIKCPVKYSIQNSGYCFVETSGPALISDSEIAYQESIKLRSKPEIMILSEGISLSDDLKEYKDAEFLMNVRQKLESGKGISREDAKKLGELHSRYGIEGDYWI